MSAGRSRNLWHEGQDAPPGSPLDRDRSADLLVIGGGFTGCSAALEAARGGAEVVLLEARTLGHGGSGRNVGLVNAGLWLPPRAIADRLGEAAGARLVAALATAPDLVFDLIAREGIDCAALRNGTLHLAHAPAGVADLRERHRQGNRLGAPLRLLDAAETARRTGSAAFHGALFDPRAGTLQPLAYCLGLARAALRAGACLHPGSAVGHLRHDGETWVAHANGHTVRARRVLLATNAYGEALNGAPAPQFVPVSFSQYATDPLPPALREGILPGGEGCWDTARTMCSLRIDGAGRLILGGVGNAAGAAAAVHDRWARRKLAALYPALAGIPFTHRWQGRIAMTADHVPKVLRLGPGALSVFGYSGRGIGPGTVFGLRAARALMWDEVDRLPLAPVAGYAEPFKRLRTAAYEAGALLAHALPVGRAP